LPLCRVSVAQRVGMRWAQVAGVNTGVVPVSKPSLARYSPAFSALLTDPWVWPAG